MPSRSHHSPTVMSGSQLASSQPFSSSIRSAIVRFYGTPCRSECENSSSRLPGRTAGAGSASSLGGDERRVPVDLEHVGQLGAAARRRCGPWRACARGRAQLGEQPAVVRDRQHPERLLAVDASRCSSPRRAGRSRGERRCRDRSRARRGSRSWAAARRAGASRCASSRHPDRSTLRGRCRNRSSNPIRSRLGAQQRDSRSSVVAAAGRRAPRRATSTSVTPGTSVGYCITRWRPAAARSPGGHRQHVDAVERDGAGDRRRSRACPSRPPRACSCRRRSDP